MKKELTKVIQIIMILAALFITSSTKATAGWSLMDTGTIVSLYSVWGTSTHVFAVGSKGTILRYDGNTWSPMNSGTEQDLNAIWGSSTTDIFIAGDYDSSNGP